MNDMNCLHRIWLVFANESSCRHAESIAKLGYINWRMANNYHFSVGDIVYLYMSDEKRVRFKMLVEEKDCVRTDNAYWNIPPKEGLTYKLKYITEYNGNLLNLKSLQRYGFVNGRSIQNPSYKNTVLMNYIDSVFDSIV